MLQHPQLLGSTHRATFYALAHELQFASCTLHRATLHRATLHHAAPRHAAPRCTAPRCTKLHHTGAQEFVPVTNELPAKAHPTFDVECVSVAWPTTSPPNPIPTSPHRISITFNPHLTQPHLPSISPHQIYPTCYHTSPHYISTPSHTVSLHHISLPSHLHLTPTSPHHISLPSTPLRILYSITRHRRSIGDLVPYTTYPSHHRHIVPQVCLALLLLTTYCLLLTTYYSLLTYILRTTYYRLLLLCSAVSLACHLAANVSKERAELTSDQVCGNTGG